MKDSASSDLGKLRKEHQFEIEKLKNDYESMKMNYENKIVQNVEQVCFTQLTCVFIRERCFEYFVLKKQSFLGIVR